MSNQAVDITTVHPASLGDAAASTTEANAASTHPAAIKPQQQEQKQDQQPAVTQPAATQPAVQQQLSQGQVQDEEEEEESQPLQSTQQVQFAQPQHQQHQQAKHQEQEQGGIKKVQPTMTFADVLSAKGPGSDKKWEPKKQQQFVPIADQLKEEAKKTPKKIKLTPKKSPKKSPKNSSRGNSPSKHQPPKHHSPKHASSHTPKKPEKAVSREYVHKFDLKYGVNPHQQSAAIYSVKGYELPFQVLNGRPGYINLMDALNSWQLVRELRHSLNLPAAASFKHVSPAGAAVAAPLSATMKQVYDCADMKLTDLAVAYIRARNADPKSSFGDFVALSDIVDEETALVLKREVSDGIIAPGFTAKAFEILKSKKQGNYIILEGNPKYKPPSTEYRELYGVCFAQQRNDAEINPSTFKKAVSANKALSKAALRDLIVASIAVKYTQSNSVCYAIDGQVIGVGAGQQSRVDCVKLAGSKVQTWYLRQHPKVIGLQFKKNTSRVNALNARIQYVEGDFLDESMFETIPSAFTEEEKVEFLKGLAGVSLSSDAFFPFRDSIDYAAKNGVKFVAQPGGSVQDAAVIKAVDEYDMVMTFSELRLFHH